MNIIKILFSVLVPFVVAGCCHGKGAEGENVNYVVVRMVARSPTSPVLGFVDIEAREIGKAHAKAQLDIQDIPAYKITSAQLLEVKQLVENARDRDAPKTPPYFVLEFGLPQGRPAAYSIGRETLSRVIPLVPSDLQEFLRLMYDSSAP